MTTATTTTARSAERRELTLEPLGPSFGAVVHDLVSGAAQMLLQLRREVETGVIGGDVDAHGIHPRSARAQVTLTGRRRRRPA